MSTQIDPGFRLPEQRLSRQVLCQCGQPAVYSLRAAKLAPGGYEVSGQSIGYACPECYQQVLRRLDQAPAS
jgi:hypothetical protein